MKGLRIFVIEDNELYAKAVSHHLTLNPDNEVEVFHHGLKALQNLYKNPQVVFLDYSLPDITGIEVLKRIKKSNPEIEVVIVSGQEDVNTAVALLKEGAYDYIVKDENARERMWKAVNNLRENSKLRSEIEQLREEVITKYDFGNIKGNSDALKTVFKLITKAARTNINVSVSGETGTGKELVAKAIHYNSAQKSKPLVIVNISGLPETLIESELFGHEKGAFTGANSRRIGKFEEAQGGTIFLDEIAELSLSVQTKLLRVLQERVVTRIGSNKEIKLDVRFIVATHKKLAEEVEKGNFREDLYYRILGLPIDLPPLRARGNDVIVLAKHFLDSFVAENRLGNKQLSAEARQKLLSYRWPGNVRELKAVMELSAVLADGGQIEVDEIVFNSSKNGLANMFEDGLKLKDYTAKIIEHYLKKYNSNVVQAADALDIGKSTIYRMIKNKEVTI